MMEFHLTKERKKEHCKSRKKKIEISLSSRWKTFFKKQKSFFTTRVEVELCLCTSYSSSFFFFFFFEQREEERSFLCETTTTLSLYLSLSFSHTRTRNALKISFVRVLFRKSFEEERKSKRQTNKNVIRRVWTKNERGTQTRIRVGRSEKERFNRPRIRRRWQSD